MWAVLYPLTEEESTKRIETRSARRRSTPSAGAIEIVRYSQWYLKDGTFDVERGINASREKLTETLEKGYAGIRLNGNEVWPMRTDWKEFSQYEEKLDQLIANERMIVLFKYIAQPVK